MKGMYAVYVDQETGHRFCHKIMSEPYTKLKSKVEEVLHRRGTDWVQSHFVPLQSSYTVILLENMSELCVSDILEVSEIPVAVPLPLYKVPVYGLCPYSPSGIRVCFNVYVRKWEDIDNLSDRPTNHLLAKGDAQVKYDQTLLEQIGTSSYLLESLRKCEDIPRFNGLVNDVGALEDYKGHMYIAEFLEPIINKKEL